MKQFEGVLICTDLDGTLLKNDKTISRENLEAIRYFKENGGFFTFVTGRMPCAVTSIADAVLPNAPFGCINGGGLFDYETKEYIWFHEMSRDAFEMVDAAESIEGLGVWVDASDVSYFHRDNSATELFKRASGTPNAHAHYRDIKTPIGKIVFAHPDEARMNELIALLAAHPLAAEFDFIRSEKLFYEILPKGMHKGVALSVLSKHLGIDTAKTVAIGDYNNDIGMLRSAGVGVAVANAVPEVKAAANYITVSNEEHAIARVISDIECGKLVL
jgi:Cof subfamily protein (haloacid dehalogenase superfamily)